MSSTVLLIDYDPRTIRRIRDLLHRSGYQTLLARDGIAGIESFERNRPDLTLIQDLIPKKHGTEVCRELKATEHGSSSPILMFAPGNNGHRRAALDAGCDACLVKPFDDEALLATVGRFLGGRAPSHAADAVAARSPVPAPVAAPHVEIAGPLSGPRISPQPAPPAFDESEVDARLDAIFDFGPVDAGGTAKVDGNPCSDASPAPTAVERHDGSTPERGRPARRKKKTRRKKVARKKKPSATRKTKAIRRDSGDQARAASA